METSPADISRGGQGGIARARIAFCRLRIRFVAPLSLSPLHIYVHIILTGKPGRPALISSTPRFAAEDDKWNERALRSLDRNYYTILLLLLLLFVLSSLQFDKY